MSPCARACCWSPYGCAQQRACACHWLDVPRTEPRTSDARPHNDPTANRAIANVMRATRNPKRPRM